MKKNMNELESIGKYLEEQVWVLKTLCKTYSDVLNLVENVLAEHMGKPIISRDLRKLRNDLSKVSGYAGASSVYMNWVLKGEGLGVIESPYHRKLRNLYS